MIRDSPHRGFIGNSFSFCICPGHFLSRLLAFSLMDVSSRTGPLGRIRRSRFPTPLFPWTRSTPSLRLTS